MLEYVYKVYIDEIKEKLFPPPPFKRKVLSLLRTRSGFNVHLKAFKFAWNIRNFEFDHLANFSQL